MTGSSMSADAALEALAARIARLGEDWGAHRVGIADLTAPDVAAAVCSQGGEWLASFPRAVSVAFRLQDAIVDRLPLEHRHALVAKTYGFHIYTAINQHLDQTATVIAGILQEAGHAAVPVPTSLSVETGGYCGPLSHKLAARAAGHGWIGRSCLLITPTVGPRVRFVTVLTDAPLPAGTPMERDCRACTECVDACPAGAFTGRAFDPNEPIEARMDVRACTAYRAASKVWSGTDICGVCVAVCPHGRRGGAASTGKN